MTPTEVLSEIRKMPLPQVREVAEQVTNYLREQEKAELTPEEIERREREFERKMYEQGFFANIPPRQLTDADFDETELLEVEGEPLSETILRLRD